MPEAVSMRSPAAAQVFPIGTKVNEQGHLVVGGCDVVDLAKAHGTPAYIYDEDDLRARARAYVETAAEVRPPTADGRGGTEVLFASKAFPCTAGYRLFGEEGLSVDVASGGELHMALAAGYDPSRIHLHGNNKTDEEIDYAIESGIGLVILDSFDEIDRWESRLDFEQRVLIRCTPGVSASTHSYIQTGQVDSKFGFGIASGAAQDAIKRILASDRLNLVGLHAHIGSQIFEVEPFTVAIEALAGIAGEWCDVLDIGGGIGVAYTAEDSPPDIQDVVRSQLAAVAAHFPDHVRVMFEPGRSLVANAGVTAYTVGTVKEIPGVRTYVAIDGGMSDNLRPMLYGARYHVVVGDRAGEAPTRTVTVAGMHCESGDIVARDVALADPRLGDTLVVAATGAYGHAMASNYNGIRRPSVLFCSGGNARTVVRRETYEDLLLRDV